MKRITKLAALAVSLSLVLSPVAQAHDRDSRDDKRPYQSQQYKQHQDRNDQRRQAERRHDDRRHVSAKHDRNQHGAYWKVGQKVPDRYRGQHYVVQTWKKHNLHQPPRGYQWVSVDSSNYFLVGVATGVVLQAILNR